MERRLTGSASNPLIRTRYRREARFKSYTVIALFVAFGIIAAFFTDIISQGYTAFWRTEVKVTLDYNERAERIGRFALAEEMREVVSRGAVRSIPLEIRNNPELAGIQREIWAPAYSRIDQYRSLKAWLTSSRPTGAFARRLTGRSLTRVIRNCLSSPVFSRRRLAR
jgi:phosphate transport system permease protein